MRDRARPRVSARESRRVEASYQRSASLFEYSGRRSSETRSPEGPTIVHDDDGSRHRTREGHAVASLSSQRRLRSCICHDVNLPAHVSARYASPLQFVWLPPASFSYRARTTAEEPSRVLTPGARSRPASAPVTRRLETSWKRKTIFNNQFLFDY